MNEKKVVVVKIYCPNEMLAEKLRKGMENEYKNKFSMPPLNSLKFEVSLE